MIDRPLATIDDYIEATAVARALVLSAARNITEWEVRAAVNAADDVQNNQVFLTVTGTSAEAGDDGETGRGNRVSGLITPNRPMTLEAAAGKNPVSHIGKLYNLVATATSNSIRCDLAGASDACCLMVSEIGQSIEDPQMIDVCLKLQPGAELDQLKPGVEAIVQKQLRQSNKLQTELLASHVPVY